MDAINDKFYYVYSSTLSDRIQIKIGTLEGKRQKPEFDKLLADPMLKFSGMYKDRCSDLMVQCEVFDQDVALTVPISTSYKAFTTRWNWNEWIVLPIQYNDLPRTAVLAMTLYECIGLNNLVPIGGTTISIFTKHGLFRQGILDLRLWPDRKADGNLPSSTPGKIKDNGKEQMQRLCKLAKKHKNGHITKVDWLDRLTFRELELINENEKRSSDYLYLMIEFPVLTVDGIPHSIVYFEQNGEDIYTFRAQADAVTVPDQEILKDNLEESKHHKLARSLRSGHCDKDAKPNATVRDKLNTIVSYPPTKPLSNDEQDHVWKFRFYLSNQKKALAKFLKCVNWTQVNEVQQALYMMEIWAPMDVEDALELLSSNFTHPAVRVYAVGRLQKAPDEDIIMYLLQLVQALKYETFYIIKEAYAKVAQNNEIPDERDNSFLKKDDEDTLQASTSLDHLQGLDIDRISTPLKDEADTVAENLMKSNIYIDSGNTDTLTNVINADEDVQDLASFLIRRASKNFTLANYFYWYLLIECEDQDSNIQQNITRREIYLTVMKTFLRSLSKGNPEMQQMRKTIAKQVNFIDKLVKLVKIVSRERGDRKKKTEKLKQLLLDTDVFKFNFLSFDPIPFPLDPNIVVKGIVPQHANLFNSALMPSKLYFTTTDDKQYVAIFKNGDDLRQDQLILQMISLMDKLLRKENLDLKLTPYKVLATSTKHGFVQFIESITIAEALAQDGSIQNYFKKYHPQENCPYGISPDIMDTYVRSCAGYCVITYLLGVGDRHLDNLLLTPCGKLFHIDFGYILGRDPKPLPPPMRLSKEMVEAMGGVTSEHYQEFRKECYTAFLHLRRHANLMLNLFSLMVDASIPDIALEPDKAVRKVQDKLRLELNEEEAVQYIQNLIDSSVSAVMPVFVDQVHKLVQMIRK